MNLSISNFNQPNATSKHQHQRESTIIWALVCSILLHIMFAVVIPKLKVDEVKKPEVLEVQLVAKPAPAPPEPIKPEEPKPIVTPTPIVKPLPKPIIKAVPDPTITPENIAPPTETVPAPKVETQPTPQVAPVTTPEPPKVMPPNQSDIDAAKSAYGDALWRAISKFKKYPNIAQRRGYQGEVVLELQLDGYGKIKSKKVAQSSGYEILDNQALEMVDKAVPFPLPAEALRNSNFSIKVPVPFKLEAP